jgi:hypothetical protein
MHKNYNLWLGFTASRILDMEQGEGYDSFEHRLWTGIALFAGVSRKTSSHSVVTKRRTFFWPDLFSFTSSHEERWL